MSLKHSIAVRMDQKTQYVADLRGARPKGFIGRPVIHAKPCEQGCTGCRDVCPTQAITLNPVALDLGRCVFCDACVDVCPEDKIEFTNDTRMGASTKADLIVK